MQTLFLATHFNPIYWNTACLIVNSGSLQVEETDREQSTDYGKIAKAVNTIKQAGIKVSLVDINKSQFGFSPDAANNQIYFGMKGMLNVGDDIVETIIKNRPYSSPRDFLNKVQPNKSVMISLIKGGAFDNMEDRKFVMAWYLWEVCDKKKRITLQNMPGLIKYNLLPEDTEERTEARRVYEFNRYLKSVCKYNANYYKLDERAINFLIEMGLNDLLLYQEDNIFIGVKSWDKMYQAWMNIFRNWINEDKDQILFNLNRQIFQEDWIKYAKKGNLSAWEMEVLCFYYHDHELKNVNKGKYGLVNFFDLPVEPEVDRTFQKGKQEIKLYKLHKICGTCIAKNKVKSTVTLLTPDGVVSVKFRKKHFSLFDKRISVLGEDNKRHIAETSWFDRGSLIVVNGMRRGDDFIAKKYASTGGHQLYKILDILPNGDLKLQDSRMQGDAVDE